MFCIDTKIYDEEDVANTGLDSSVNSLGAMTMLLIEYVLLKKRIMKDRRKNYVLTDCLPDALSVWVVTGKKRR